MGQSPSEVIRIKAAVRERDGHQCTKCGVTADEHLRRHGRGLDVHRTVPGSLYSLAGCVSLCLGCHAAEPGRKPGQPDLAGCNSGVKVFIPWAHRAPLKRLAARNGRTITAEVGVALEKHYQAEGVPARPPRRT